MKPDLIKRLRSTPLYDSSGEAVDDLADEVAEALSGLPTVDEAMAYADGYAKALEDCANADVAALIKERDVLSGKLAAEKGLVHYYRLLTKIYSSPQDSMCQADASTGGETSSEPSAPLHPVVEGRSREDQLLINDLAMLTGKLARRLQRQQDTSGIAEQARDSLSRKGLLGSVLRKDLQAPPLRPDEEATAE